MILKFDSNSPWIRHNVVCSKLTFNRENGNNDDQNYEGYCADGDDGNKNKKVINKISDNDKESNNNNDNDSNSDNNINMKCLIQRINK